MEHFFKILEICCPVIFHAEYDRFLKTGSEFACEIEHALKADTVGFERIISVKSQYSS